MTLTFSEMLITVTSGQLDEKINTTLMLVQSIQRHSSWLSINSYSTSTSETHWLPRSILHPNCWMQTLSEGLVPWLKCNVLLENPDSSILKLTCAQASKLLQTKNTPSWQQHSPTAPCHTTKSAQARPKEHDTGLPKSPDVNQTTHLWDLPERVKLIGMIWSIKGRVLWIQNWKLY